jgi:hypothetical protein
MNWEQLKNPQVWMYLFSFLKVLTAALGLEIAPEQWDQWEQILNALAGLGVALGIFAFNPYQRQRGEKKE